MVYRMHASRSSLCALGSTYCAATHLQKTIHECADVYVDALLARWQRPPPQERHGLLRLGSQ